MGAYKTLVIAVHKPKTTIQFELLHISEYLEKHPCFTKPDSMKISDEGCFLQRAITEQATNYHLIIICGGSTIHPGDQTPQILQQTCHFPIPGLGEILRQIESKATPAAALNRHGGWAFKSTLILALDRNPKIAREQIEILGQLIETSITMLTESKS